jgi:hypothetical protein
MLIILSHALAVGTGWYDLSSQKNVRASLSPYLITSFLTILGDVGHESQSCGLRFPQTVLTQSGLDTRRPFKHHLTFSSVLQL